MGQSSRVAPEPLAAVPMAFRVRISNEQKKEKIASALLYWMSFGEGHRQFNSNEDELEIFVRGNFVPGTLDMCLHEYARYLEIEHVEAT
nr:hypothetical protein [Tanacetum cinerariifolium]